MEIQMVAHQISYNAVEDKFTWLNELEEIFNTYYKEKHKVGAKERAAALFRAYNLKREFDVKDLNFDSAFDDIAAVMKMLRSHRSRVKNRTTSKRLDLTEYTARVNNVYLGAKHSWRD